MKARAAELADGPVTLINRFTVTGSAEEFERAFATTAAYFAEQPGFIDHNLLRQTDEPRSYVNVARWTDGASLRAAVTRPEFKRHALALRAVSTSDPKVFSVRLTTTAVDAG
ncbi:MAG: antibiotic biosynthesis monooxygenase [Thermomonospora sp. CIF 1]|nr:MAG: antibiotic biosynthesis monooxygenase [Thermomonospora sp. CIF 1]